MMHTNGPEPGAREKVAARRKRIPVLTAKPDELRAGWGRPSPHSHPDLCYAWGPGADRSDASLLHNALSGPVCRFNFDRPKNPCPLDYVVYEPSFLKELERRGYDLTTLKFSIQKKETPCPSPLEDEARGTFACPICGIDSPHEHSGAEIQAFRVKAKLPEPSSETRTFYSVPLVTDETIPPAASRAAAQQAAETVWPDLMTSAAVPPPLGDALDAYNPTAQSARDTEMSRNLVLPYSQTPPWVPPLSDAHDPPEAFRTAVQDVAQAHPVSDFPSPVREPDEEQRLAFCREALLAASRRFPDLRINPSVDGNLGYLGTYSGMVADHALRLLTARALGESRMKTFDGIKKVMLEAGRLDVDCRRCFEAHPDASPFNRPFIVCPTCGNKRCPKATFHELVCTNSNEPGQAGSDYQ